MITPPHSSRIAIACGGTGGHLFPGLAVADALQQWGCEIDLLISQKEVDQEAVKSARGMRILCLPAIGLQNGRGPAFVRGFWKSLHLCRGLFREMPPRAVLAMGGFTSAPPILAGKSFGAATFLHESNSIPGRANRWLAPWVDDIFVGYAVAGRRLFHQSVSCLGTPVRPQFTPADPAPCRLALGLDPSQPVLLVMGGSQGATGINQLVKGALPLLLAQMPELQFIHLSGATDYQSLQEAYAKFKCRAVVRPFLTEIDLALGAATVAINRAGASSLAEMAAMRVPAVLVPYPHATDNHQLYNAQALGETGAARILVQASATPQTTAQVVLELLRDESQRAAMQRALQQWCFPNAAREIADYICKQIGQCRPEATAEEAALPFSAETLKRLPRWRGHSESKFKLPKFELK